MNDFYGLIKQLYQEKTEIVCLIGHEKKIVVLEKVLGDIVTLAESSTGDKYMLNYSNIVICM